MVNLELKIIVNRDINSSYYPYIYMGGSKLTYGNEESSVILFETSILRLKSGSYFVKKFDSKGNSEIVDYFGSSELEDARNLAYLLVSDESKKFSENWKINFKED